MSNSKKTYHMKSMAIKENGGNARYFIINAILTVHL